MADEWIDVHVSDPNLMAKFEDLRDRHNIGVMTFPGYWCGQDAVALVDVGTEMPLIMVRLNDYEDREACLFALACAWDVSIGKATEIDTVLEAMIEGYGKTKQ